MALQFPEATVRGHFLSSREMIERDVAPVFAQSLEYVGVASRVERLLWLVDRLFLSSEGHLQHGGLLRRVFDALEKHRAGAADVGSDLLRDVLEPALKLVLDRVDPVVYQNSLGGSFTLSKVVNALGLLGPAEAGVPRDELYKIKEPVRRLIRLAWYERNPETHGAPLVQDITAIQQRQAFYVTLLAAVDRHRGALERALQGLTTQGLDGPETTLVRQIHSAYREHLGRFIGRRLYVEKIADGLRRRTESESGYILVHGPEGFGKTALAVKVVACLAEGIEPIGPHGADIGRQCPWIFGGLLHLGKWERQPAKFVPALIAQANAKLLRPFAPSIQDQRALVSSRTVHESLGLRHGASSRTPLLGHGIRSESHGDSSTSDYGAVIFELLGRLVEERGQAIVIVDALDEISSDGADLSFLPPVLPAGAAVLLTARRESPLIDRIRRAVNPREIALEGLSLDESRQLSGVDDDSWNEKLHKASRGCPLLVVRKAEEVREKNGAFEKVDPSEGDRALLRSQVESWRIEELNDSADPLYQSLLLLAVFDSVAPLEISLLQGYLELQGISSSGARLRSVLERVGSQLEGFDEGTIKLAVRALAEYVLDRHLSQRDLKRLLEGVARWLAEDNEVSDSVIALFLLRWADPDQVKSSSLREVAASLVKRLEGAGRVEALWSVFNVWSETSKIILPQLVRQSLANASMLGDARAARALGSRMIDGRGVPQDLVEGEKLLRAAAASGLSAAQFELGVRLVEGDGLPKNIVEGRDWIEQAASNNEAPRVSAMKTLAEYHLDGIFPDADPVQGERWLLLARSEGDDAAAVDHAMRLVWGRWGSEKRELGIRLLRDRSAAGSIAATVNLGLVLAQDHDSESVRAEGFKLIRDAAERDVQLRGFLGWMSLSESWPIGIDKNEAQSWLQKAAESGVLDAMYRIGTLLLDGKVLAQDVKQGWEWLLKAVRGQHPSAKHSHAKRLLLGDGCVKNVERGERLLRELAAAEYVPAMRHLGGALLYGNDGLKQDRKEGLRWVEAAILAGDPGTMQLLGVWIYRESLRQKNGSDLLRQRAASLFCRAYATGDFGAGIDLAYMVRRGEAKLPVGIDSVEKLLESGLKDGSILARINDALRIVSGGARLDGWVQVDSALNEMRNDKDEIKGALNWWHETSQLGDPEGHLVIGWLARYGLIDDPDGRSIEWRMQKARDGGWAVPDWMDGVRTREIQH